MKRSRCAHQLLAELLLALVVGLDDVLAQLARPASSRSIALGSMSSASKRGRVDLLELGEQPVEVPVLDEVARQCTRRTSRSITPRDLRLARSSDMSSPSRMRSRYL